MKKVQSLSKFKNYELKTESVKLITGGTVICTTMRNGAKYTDTFNDSSKNSSGGWPASDLTCAS